MPSLRKLHARYRGRCRTCNKHVAPGDVIYYDGLARRLYCETCGQQPSETNRQPSQQGARVSLPTCRMAISKRKLALWSIALVGALFSIGLLSDRLWPISFAAAIVSAAWCWRTSVTADARVLLIASLALFVLASGSMTRDCLSGGLFDHGPSALCNDGTYSYSENHRGTCSWHHGVAAWNPVVPWWRRM